MVATAQRSRAPIQRLADQVSGWFVPLDILIAIALAGLLVTAVVAGLLVVGLPGTRRLVDEFDIETAPSAGTTVTLTAMPGTRTRFDHWAGAATGALCYNEDALPDEYHGNLFLADFGKRNILRVKVERDGATVRALSADSMDVTHPAFAFGATVSRSGRPRTCCRGRTR